MGAKRVTRKPIADQRAAEGLPTDSNSLTQRDIDNGTLGVVIGMAEVKPAEFVVIGLQQIAGEAPQTPPGHPIKKKRKK